MAKRGRKARLVPVASDEVEAPPGLSAAESREFRRLVERCREAGTLARADVSLIENTARIKASIDASYAELGNGPKTITAVNGQLMVHPLKGLIDQETRIHRGLLKDLGLTPGTGKAGDRTNGKTDEANPWAGLLSVTG